MSRLRLALVAMITAGALGCQDYPFEIRLPKRVSARKLNEVVATVRPTDILLVVDTSGSMLEEHLLLKSNVASFVEELLDNNVDFHLGIIAPDMECNIPERSCTAPDGPDGNTNPDAAPGGVSSVSCCAINPPACVDTVATKSTTCDGGRLRKASGGAFFTRPGTSAAAKSAWVADVVATLDLWQCKSSPYEAAFEAAVKAVACAIGHADCTGPSSSDILAINDGFVRDDADLVIVFMSDEDDCSLADYETPLVTPYGRFSDPGDGGEQLANFCDQKECYAHRGVPADGWRTEWFDCDTIPRSVDPPSPTGVDIFIQKLIDYKALTNPVTPVKRVRAAAIVGSVIDTTARFGYTDKACFRTPSLPSDACGCSATFPVCSSCSSDFFCDLTAKTQAHSTPFTALKDGVQQCGGGTIDDVGGCEAMPAKRYLEFLDVLANRRITAGAQPDALVDSICRNAYDDTLSRIVHNVILSSCFTLPEEPKSADDIEVHLNGDVLDQVDDGSTLPGWSWVEGTTEVCLEGGLRRELDDRFEILFVTE
jgi:hypothetical protein